MRGFVSRDVEDPLHDAQRFQRKSRRTRLRLLGLLSLSPEQLPRQCHLRAYSKGGGLAQICLATGSPSNSCSMKCSERHIHQGCRLHQCSSCYRGARSLRGGGALYAPCPRALVVSTALARCMHAQCSEPPTGRTTRRIEERIEKPVRREASIGTSESVGYIAPRVSQQSLITSST